LIEQSRATRKRDREDAFSGEKRARWSSAVALSLLVLCGVSTGPSQSVAFSEEETPVSLW